MIDRIKQVLHKAVTGYLEYEYEGRTIEKIPQKPKIRKKFKKSYRKRRARK